MNKKKEYRIKMCTLALELLNKGFEPLNHDKISWMGYNPKTRKIVISDGIGFSKVYEFKGLLQDE